MSRPRGLQLILILSLSVNLVVLGSFMTRYWHREPPLGWAVQQLDDRTRAAVRPLLRQRGTRGLAIRRELRASRDRIRDLMAEETLDKDALRAELRTLREVSTEYQSELHNTAVDLLANLPPDQRRRVVRRILMPQPGGR